MRFKRAMAFVLAVIMILSILPVSAFAVEEGEDISDAIIEIVEPPVQIPEVVESAPDPAVPEEPKAEPEEEPVKTEETADPDQTADPAPAAGDPSKEEGTPTEGNNEGNSAGTPKTDSTPYIVIYITVNNLPLPNSPEILFAQEYYPAYLTYDESALAYSALVPADAWASDGRKVVCIWQYGIDDANGGTVWTNLSGEEGGCPAGMIYGINVKVNESGSLEVMGTAEMFAGVFFRCGAVSEDGGLAAVSPVIHFEENPEVPEELMPAAVEETEDGEEITEGKNEFEEKETEDNTVKEITEDKKNEENKPEEKIAEEKIAEEKEEEKENEGNKPEADKEKGLIKILTDAVKMIVESVAKSDSVAAQGESLPVAEYSISIPEKENPEAPDDTGITVTVTVTAPDGAAVSSYKWYCTVGGAETEITSLSALGMLGFEIDGNILIVAGDRESVEAASFRCELFDEEGNAVASTSRISAAAEPAPVLAMSTLLGAGSGTSTATLTHTVSGADPSQNYWNASVIVTAPEGVASPVYKWYWSLNGGEETQIVSTANQMNNVTANGYDINTLRPAGEAANFAGLKFRCEVYDGETLVGQTEQFTVGGNSEPEEPEPFSFTITKREVFDNQVIYLTETVDIPDGGALIWYVSDGSGPESQITSEGITVGNITFTDAYSIVIFSGSDEAIAAAGNISVRAEVVSSGGNVVGTSNSVTVGSHVHTPVFVSEVWETNSATHNKVTTYRCSVCEEIYEERSGEENHDFELTFVPHTQTEGEYTLRGCKICGYSDKINVGNPGQHTLTLDSENSYAATCEADGLEHYFCGCGYTEDKALPRLGHDYQVSRRVESTCTTLGYITYVCSHDETHTFDEPLKELAPHNWSEWGPTTSKDPEKTDYCPCEDTGVHTRRCQNEGCTATETADVAPTGHKWKVDDTTDADGWKVVTSPTCSAEGSAERVCENYSSETHDCTHCKETKVLPVAPHDYNENWICRYCGKTYPEVQEIIDGIDSLLEEVAQDPIKSQNAQKYHDEAYGLIQKIDSIKNSTDEAKADLRSALNKLVSTPIAEGQKSREQQVRDIIVEAGKYLEILSYDSILEDEVFLVRWNDNGNADGGRPSTAGEDILSHATLNFTVKDSAGNVVTTGSFVKGDSTKDPNEFFKFLGSEYDPLAEGENYFTIDSASSTTEYTISLNEKFPGAYYEYIEDPSTGVTEENFYQIEYSLAINDPVSGYVFTAPSEGTSATVPENGSATLTKLKTWEATVTWLDDNNRPAGIVAGDTPRLTADELISNYTLYSYHAGETVGQPVTFDYTVSSTRTGNVDSLSIDNLPAYDDSGLPIYYYLTKTDPDSPIPAANAGVVSGNGYSVSYENVGNQAEKTDALYEGGNAKAVLSNQVNFEFTKIWADDGNTNRGNPYVLLYRAVEEYIPNLYIKLDAVFPIPGAENSQSIPTDQSTVTMDLAQNLPMYDGNGCRYVYFGVEKEVPSNYDGIIDNRTGNVLTSHDVIQYFEDDPLGQRFFVNGGTVKNEMNETKTPSVTKDFAALSLQNGVDITSTFILQKYDSINKIWVNYSTSDIDEDDSIISYDSEMIDINADGTITMTFDRYTAENMSQSAAPITFRKYDSNAGYSEAEFRWVETATSVNGISAGLDPSKWITDGDNLRYVDQVIVNVGQKSEVLGDDTNKTSGPEDTTAIFTATATGSNDNRTFTNTLVGDYQVDIKKTFFDKDGNNISADASRFGTPDNPKGYIEFTLFCDGQPYKKSPADENGKIRLNICDLVNGSGDDPFWEKIVSLPRYDESGREYVYTVRETKVYDVPGAWLQIINYDEFSVKSDNDPNVLVRRLFGDYENHDSPGSSLIFEVEKKWLDDSDMVSRKPVYYTLYRIKDANGDDLTVPEIVATASSADGTAPELCSGNNWYQCFRIPASDIKDESGNIIKHDSVDNYVMVERYVDNAETAVNYTVGGITDVAGLKTINGAITTGFALLGTVGSEDASGKRQDDLAYKYEVLEQRSTTEEGVGSFTFENRRVGLQNLSITKMWQAGGKYAPGVFSLTQDGVIKETFRVSRDAGGTFHVEFGHVVEEGTDYKWTSLEDGETPWHEQVGGSVSCTTSSDGKTITVSINDLPKFDEIGAQRHCRIEEIYIEDNSNTLQKVENGTCTVDGDSYTITYRENAPLYGDEEHHHTPDYYSTDIINTRHRTCNLKSFKVWRDDGKYVRPDVSFTPYRVSAKNYGGDVDAAVAAVLDGNFAYSETIGGDFAWNTKLSQGSDGYCFSYLCNIAGMPQYDPEGYQYIYYGKEVMSASGSMGYETLYSNETSDNPAYRPVPQEPVSGYTWDVTPRTKAVFGIETSVLEQQNDPVFIISDGLHAASNGRVEDYYSSTVVNMPVGTRTLNGEKLWLLPHGVDIPKDQMPAVQVDLYRSLTELKYKDFDSNEAYIAAITDNGRKSPVVTKTIGSGDNYKFVFDKDSAGNPIDMFDEYGQTYYYYPIEIVDAASTSLQNFPADKIRYIDKDFNITNVFSSVGPYVEVTVKKTWVIQDGIFEDPAKYGLPDDFSAEDLASAEFTLYGTFTNSNGEKLSYTKAAFGPSADADSVILSPTDVTGENKTVTVEPVETATGIRAHEITVTYTFREFYNDLTGAVERLPYYCVRTNPMHYSVDEKIVNGYETTVPGTSRTEVDITFDTAHPIATDPDIVYGNVNNPLESDYTNTYTGELTDVPYKKVWDEYVNNDEYRPDEIDFVLRRTTASIKAAAEADPSMPAYDTLFGTNGDYTVTLNKSGNEGKKEWSGELKNQLKYSPSGEKYEYYVFSETFKYYTPGTADIDPAKTQGPVTIDQLAAGEDTVIGDYKLVGKTNSSLTNKLVSGTKVEMRKTWDLKNGETLSFEKFDTLRKIGAYPSRIQYILQRSKDNGTSWSDVPAAEITGNIYVVNTGTSYVVGREVNIDAAIAFNDNYIKTLNAQTTWENLPVNDKASGAEYSYRVIERLIWANGRIDTIEGASGTAHGIDGTSSISFNQDKNTWEVSLNNTLATKKLRLAKRWIDENSRENSRPDKIYISICPSGLTTEANRAQHTLTVELATRGNPLSEPDPNLYVSTEEFDIADPEKFPLTFGTDKANYDVTESFTDKNGNTVTINRSDVRFTYDGIEYYTSEISPDNTVHTEGTDLYTVTLVNTAPITIKRTVYLSATKKWTNDANWKDVTRPVIEFELQFKKEGDSSFSSFSDAEGGTPFSYLRSLTAEEETEYGSEKPKVTITYNSEGNPVKVYWHGMRKYWPEVGTDGVAIPITYRVVEKANPESSYNSMSYTSSPQTFSFDDYDSTSEITYENKLQRYKTKLIKEWTGIKADGSGSAKISADNIESLIALKAIPEYITFRIQYSTDNGTSWTDVPATTGSSGNEITAGGLITVKTADLINGVTTVSALPKYDKNGNLIKYRIYETAVKYSGSNVSLPISWPATITGTSEGTLGNITARVQEFTIGSGTKTVTFNNDYKYTSLVITKEWLDEDNRDGSRNDVSITLYRDSSEYATASSANPTTISKFCTVSKTETNVWKFTWDYLPYYQNDKPQDDASKSVYTFAETTGAAGYAITYVDGEAVTHDPANPVTNTYQPQRGSIKATKNWDDYNDVFNTRPDTIYLKLQYKDSAGSWQDVEQGYLAKVNGKDLYFTENNTTDLSKLAPGTKAYTTNDLPADKWISISKNSDGSWPTYTWNNLPVNLAVENRVTYQVIEGVKSGDTIVPVVNNTPDELKGYSVTNSGAVNVTDSVTAGATVKNTLGRVSKTVEKVWKNESDKDISKYRPTSVRFKFEYKKSNEDENAWRDIPSVTGISGLTFEDGHSYAIVTGTGWKTNISNLPKTDSAGNTFQYRVTEAAIIYGTGASAEVVTADANGEFAGPYDVTYGEGGISATNTLVTGSLKVEKIWQDESNRDGGTHNITVELLRDGLLFEEKEMTVTGGVMSAEFDKLPVYKNDATGRTENDKSVYTVREKGETKGEDGRITVTDANGVEYDVSHTNSTTTLDKTTQATDTVTNKHIPYRGTVSATKVWEDNNNAFGSRPSKIYLKLQYSTDGSSWNDVDVKLPEAELAAHTDGSDVYTTSDIGWRTVTPNTDGTWPVCTWENLPVNVISSGASVPVYYRVVEGVKNEYFMIVGIEDGGKLNGYTVTYSPKSIQLQKQTGGSYTASETVTNTLDLTWLTITKKWIDNCRYFKPVSAEFKLYGRVKGADDKEWKQIGSTYTCTAGEDIVLDPETQYYNYSGEVTVTGLPVTDALGIEYEYRVEEVSAAYSLDNTDVTVNAVGSFVPDDGTTWTGIAGVCSGTITISKETDDSGKLKFTADAVNTPVIASLEAEKVWTDANNRDGGEKTVWVQLFRDGVKFGTLIPLKSDNNWKYKWTELPVYKDYATGEKSVYTVKETDELGNVITGFDSDHDGVKIHYTVSYPDGYASQTIDAGQEQTPVLKVENTHEILTFPVKATKLWNDADDKYSFRPTEITLKLQYSLDGENWNDVVAKPDTDDGTAVFTTSSLNQTLTKPAEASNEWGTAVWEGLPAFALNGSGESVLVRYRATETNVPANYDLSPSAPVTYVDYLKSEKDPLEVSVQVKNDLHGYTSLSVNKSWEDTETEGGNPIVARPDKITVQLQYRKPIESGWSEWINVSSSGTAELTADNGWKFTWEALRNDYEYRALEVSVTRGDKVYRVSSADGLSGTVDVYTFITAYDADSKTTTLTNTLVTGSIEVTKTWTDVNDRDGARQPITVELYRDNGTEAYKTAVLNEANSWTYAWENLPVYSGMTDAEGNPVKSVYKVRESGESNRTVVLKNSDGVDVSYSVTYSPETVPELDPATAKTASVSNTHTPIVFSVNATKTWDDYNNKYGLRPAAVALKLQWTLTPDDEDSWDDVPQGNVLADTEGTLVCTSSSPVQMLYGENSSVGVNTWGTALWEKLPAYVLVPNASTGKNESKLVYYRATEAGYLPPAYGLEPGDAVSYLDSESGSVIPASGVTDPLVDDTYLAVTKYWYNKSTLPLEKYMPLSVVCQLQYRDPNTGFWRPVPSNGVGILTAENGWKYCFEGLRNDLEYRCIETEIVYKHYTIKVNSPDSIKEKLENISAGGFSVTSVTVQQIDDEGHVTYETALSNTLTNRPRTGDEAQLGLFAMTGLASMLGIGGSGIAIGRGRRRKRK